jgi:threonine aldolase
MIVDFRSDTVTKPSTAMLDAMFSAETGDDVFGEDPTVNALQNYVANYFGKEASLFCSSGTQTNQIAINVHVQPGGEVICHEESHIYKYEGGGIAKNSGASVRLLQGNRGRITKEQIEKWINPEHDVHFPLTQLISLEDTANRGGGAIYNFEDIKNISDFSRSKKIPLHLDGARLMNALIETKIDPKEYAQQFDSISLCLSKGLGAPIGSVLIGSNDFIKKAHRVRKVFGGGMRQAGIIAAAGLYALEHNVDRLAIDHFHAKLLSETMHSFSWIKEIVAVETNIIVVVLKEETKRDYIIQELANKGIKTIAFGPGMIRFVTHLNVSAEQVNYTLEKLKEI